MIRRSQTQINETMHTSPTAQMQSLRNPQNLNNPGTENHCRGEQSKPLARKVQMQQENWNSSKSLEKQWWSSVKVWLYERHHRRLKKRRKSDFSCDPMVVEQSVLRMKLRKRGEEHTVHERSKGNGSRKVREES